MKKNVFFSFSYDYRNKSLSMSIEIHICSNIFRFHVWIFTTVADSKEQIGHYHKSSCLYVVFMVAKNGIRFFKFFFGFQKATFTWLKEDMVRACCLSNPVGAHKFNWLVTHRRCHECSYLLWYVNERLHWSAMTVVKLYINIYV